MGPYFVVGDAHHDENVVDTNCGATFLPIGHIASSFNDPRNKIVAAWKRQGAYFNSVIWKRWRNSAPITQCDGTVTSSDGMVAFLKAPTQ